MRGSSRWISRWARLKEQSPDKAQVVSLKFFAGLTNQEVALAMNVTERTVERQWAYAKAWLHQEMQTAEPDPAE